MFKPSQLFTWPELRRMVRLGGRIAVHAARHHRRALRLLERSRHSNAVQDSRTPRGSCCHDQRVLAHRLRDVLRPRRWLSTSSILGTHEDSRAADRRVGYVLIVGNRFQSQSRSPSHRRTARCRRDRGARRPGTPTARCPGGCRAVRSVGGRSPICTSEPASSSTPASMKASASRSSTQSAGGYRSWLSTRQ